MIPSSAVAIGPSVTPVAVRPRPDELIFRACWGLIAVAAAGLVFVLQAVWFSKPDFHDRFLIPMGSIGLAYWDWQRLRSAKPAPAWWGLLLLAPGAALFAVGWYIVVQVSARPIIVWWLTSAFVLAALGLIVVHRGRHHARMVLFPLLFIFFSLPTPDRVYRPLEMRLKAFTTAAAQTILPLLGIPVERPDPTGYDLVLPTGSLGIVEACSGVRSITALTAIAVFVAYVRGFRPLRGLILVGLTTGVVAVTNSLRVITTGILQETLGRGAIEGWPHEALGIAVILVGFGLILALSTWIAPRNPTQPMPPSQTLTNHGGKAFHRSMIAFAILFSAASACLWSEQFRFDYRVQFRVEDIAPQLGTWKGIDLPVAEMIKDELICDQILYRKYQNELGREVQVWVMFWPNAATTAHMHHPDICYPFRGWEVTTSRVRPLTLTGQSELPVSVRHYQKPAHQQIVFFWTQHGSYVLPDGVQGPELFSGHSWIFKILEGHEPLDRGARISVEVGMQTRGSPDVEEKTLRDFTRLLAEDMYSRWPWARPTSSPPAD